MTYSFHHFTRPHGTLVIALLVLVLAGFNLFGCNVLESALKRTIISTDYQASHTLNSTNTIKNDSFIQTRHSSPLFLPFRKTLPPDDEMSLLDDFGNGFAIPCYNPKTNVEHIFLLHMRKAGGSTIRKSILLSMLSYLNLSETARTIKEFGDPFAEMGDEVWRHRQLQNDTKTLYMTHLRDPIERIVSHYINEGGVGGPVMARDWQKGKTSMEEIEFMSFPAWVALGKTYSGEAGQGVGEWLRQRPNTKRGRAARYTHNYYLKRLTGTQDCSQANLDLAIAILSQFDIVLVTEHLSEMYDYVEQRLVPRRRRRHVNFPKEPFDAKIEWYGEPEAQKLDERNRMRSQVKMEHKELLRAIEEENTCDRILYNVANRMRTQQRICVRDEKDESSP